MTRTLFCFGRTPDLAFLELRSFFPDARRIRSDVAAVDGETDAVSYIGRLGGTVRIVREVPGLVPDQEHIASYLRSHAEGPLTFGVSVYGKSAVSESLLASVKKDLSGIGITARYVQAKDESALSSVVVAKQHLTEIVAVYTDSGVVCGITEAIQDFEAWNKRDSARPSPDARRGMLPPKVARMIINIALRFSGGRLSEDQAVLDPFCGVGTILAEGMLAGADAMGSDVDADAIEKSRKNLEWLRAEYGLLSTKPPSLYVSDATHLSEYFRPGSLDAIVTEPFMGRQGVTDEGEVKNILKGLQKLYLGCLKEWSGILKPGGKIVMAMPAYKTAHGIVSVKNVIDRCENLGYTLVIGPIEYSRPMATVRREFYIFQKSQNRI